MNLKNSLGGAKVKKIYFIWVKNTKNMGLFFFFKFLAFLTIFWDKKYVVNFKIFFFEYLSISKQIFLSKIFAHITINFTNILKKNRKDKILKKIFFMIRKSNEILFLSKNLYKFHIKVEKFNVDLSLIKEGKIFRKKIKQDKFILNEFNKNRKECKEYFKKRRENMIHETRKKFSLKNIYSHSVPEYSQTRGWFDSKKIRIKKFCDFWDESNWIFHKFFTEKYFKNKKYIYLKEQLFFSFLFCQTNKNDMCSICIHIQNFPYDEKVLLIFPSFLGKILFFDEKWNHIVSEFKERITKTIHSGVGVDICFDNLILIRGENSNENPLGGEFAINDTLIKKNFNFFANCIGPKSYFLNLLKENKNLEKPQSFNLIFRKIFLKPILNLFVFYSKWHKKCEDSFFPGNYENLSLFIFLVSKKIFHLNEYKKPLNFFLVQIFQKKFSYQWKIAKNDFFNEIQFKNFLNYNNNKIKKKGAVYFQPKILTSKFYFEKAKHLSNSSKILNKISREKDYFENFILIISFKKIFLTLLLKKFKKKIEKQKRKIYIDEATIQLMKLFNSQDFYPFEKKNYESKLKSHRLCMINLQKKNQNNEFSEIVFFISFGTFSEINNVKQHKIRIDKKKFSKMIIMLCAHFGVNFLFFLISDSFEWEIVQTLKNIVFNLRENIQSNYQNKKTRALKIFLEKLKIITFDKNSVNYQLSKTLNAKTLSKNKFKNLLCSTILLLNKGIYSLSWFLTLKKKEKAIKFNNFVKNIKPSIIKELLNLLMKIKFQEIFLGSEHFYPDKNRFFLLRYNCSFGLRKANDFSQHIIKDNNLISAKDDKKKKSNYKVDTFESSTNYCNKYKDFIFTFQNKTSKNKLGGFLHVHLKKLINYKRFIEKNHDDIKIFFIKNERQNFFFKKIHWMDKKITTALEKVSPLEIFLFKNFKFLFELSYKVSRNCFLEEFIENYICNQKSNVFLKKWEEIFQEKNRIGQIVFNKATMKENNYHIHGLTNNSFKFFIHKKDCFNNPLKFEKLILRKIKNFPGKIFSIYSKISQVRLILTTAL